MNYVTEAFTARTFASVAADASTLPLTQEAYDDLVALLADEESYTYATLKSDDPTYETVKLHVENGVLLMERGIEGTQAVKHPCGTTVCLVSPTTLAAMKDVICQWECCNDECPCSPVKVLASEVPASWTKGWTNCGYVIFEGTLPILVAAGEVPDWLTVTVRGNVAFVEGTPTDDAEDFELVLAASNCGGKRMCVERIDIAIEE